MTYKNDFKTERYYDLWFMAHEKERETDIDLIFSKMEMVFYFRYHLYAFIFATNFVYLISFLSVYSWKKKFGTRETWL